LYYVKQRRSQSAVRLTVKSTRCSHTLKGSHEIRDGRILLEHPRDASFKKDLSNEPNFSRIFLAGQHL
jgi:hypothetical protein